MIDLAYCVQRSRGRETDVSYQHERDMNLASEMMGRAAWMVAEQSDFEMEGVRGDQMKRNRRRDCALRSYTRDACRSLRPAGDAALSGMERWMEEIKCSIRCHGLARFKDRTDLEATSPSTYCALHCRQLFTETSSSQGRLIHEQMYNSH